MRSLPHLSRKPMSRIPGRSTLESVAPRTGPLCVVLAAAMLVLFSGNLHAQAVGIAIFKESTAHSDSAAKVFEYTVVQKMGAVTHYHTPIGQTVKLTKFQPQLTISYPDLMSRSITNPSQLGLFENGAKSYRGIVAKYPNTARFLIPYIQTSEEIIRRVKRGDVLFNGQFMARSEYDALIQREEAIARDFRDKSRAEKQARENLARRLATEKNRHKRW